MKEGSAHKVALNAIFTGGLLVLICIHGSWCSPLDNSKGPTLTGRSTKSDFPAISPSATPQPFLPPLAPSPLVPFTNSSVPKLSGLCRLNFTEAESLMSLTSIDCYAFFAPLVANIICCPQLEATLAIVIGQQSKNTNVLALNGTHAKHCLSDIEQILVGQGASNSLKHLCALYPSNLTEASCPVKDVDEFESTVDTSELLAACERIDPVKECCQQICQNAILDAARKISSKDIGVLNKDRTKNLTQHSSKINDCRRIVFRWLASKVDASRAKQVLRGLSNCNANKVCPLVLPNARHVAKDCADDISNQTACCSAMDSYVSHLQKQSFITNLQALDCSRMLGVKLQNSNVTKNVYSICRISLKDFSLQVGSQEAGCLLPSLPSDATLDESSGISFVCDLNDNIPAPWPSAYQSPTSSCNKSLKIPALPAATSGQCGLYSGDSTFHVIFVPLIFLLISLLH